MSQKSPYFQQLNYSLANEDSRLERTVVQSLAAKSILAICGSGGRSLPLAQGEVKRLSCCDLSAEQLYLAELRMVATRELDFTSYCLFWGFPPFKTEENSEARQKIFQALPLSEAVRSYFRALFEQEKWQGLLYVGRWEKTMISMPRILRHVIGGSYDQMFDFQELKSQQEYFDQRLRSPLWNVLPVLVLKLIGNAAYFNAFLYHGGFVQKNIRMSYFEFYKNAFKRMFYRGLARENFFLQLVFLGRLRFPEGNPIEAHPEVYAASQACLQKLNVGFYQQSIFEHAGTTRERYDFVSLSDVPSYLQGSHEREFLQELRPCLLPGAVVVSRCYLRIPAEINQQNFSDITDQYRELLEQESTQMYHIMIHRYEGSPV